MRKLSFLLLALFVMSSAAEAVPTYYTIANFWPTPVYVTPGGTTVTVTESGGAGTGSIGAGCGVSPYQVGRNKYEWFDYAFSPGITHIRLKMVRIHDDDTVRITINGTPYTNFSAGLSAFGGSCGASSGTIVTLPGGYITSTGTPTGVGSGIQIDVETLPTTNFSNLRVEHIRHSTNVLASDVTYGLEIASDTCELKFEAVVDTPACSGRDIKFSATEMPNTTYTWTAATGVPNWAPSGNVREPVLVSANATNSGQYFVKADRGVCEYKDTVSILVSQTPAISKVTQTGPVCPGEDDTIKVLVNLALGGKVYTYGKFPLDSFDAAQGHIYTFQNIQKSDAGIYNLYAKDLQGCISDTVVYDMKIKPDVTAAFAFDIKEGCEQDSVKFTNLSLSDSNLNYRSVWNFGDNTPLLNLNDSIYKDTTHYYKIPKPHYDAREYDVRLIVTNGRCSETVEQKVNINHPIKAKFVADDDSICQGEEIGFIAGDSSYVKPGTTPKFLWKYGDGLKDTTIDTKHVFEIAGNYATTFVLTDYLGCVDSFSVPVIVDSSGFVVFAGDKDAICVGDEVVFTADYSDYAYTSAIWDFGDGVTLSDSKLLRHSFTKPGVYNVNFDITYRICPPQNFNADITVKPYPNLYLGDDTAICPNGSPIFIGDMLNSAANVKYQWHTPNKDVTQGIYVHHPGIYAVTADLDGCKVTDSLEVKKNCYINIPNAFTPNNDGNSDYFLPRQVLSRNVTEFSMQIYNRWGQLIFQSNSADGRGWDGKFKNEDQPSGVYVYTIQVSFGNGVSERYQGNVTLLR